MSFIAKWDTLCGDCGLTVKGQSSRYEGEGNIVHVKCPSVKICPDCHMTKPCDCD